MIRVFFCYIVISSEKIEIEIEKELNTNVLTKSNASFLLVTDLTNEYYI
jgi:hypothetical protein